MNIIDTIRCEKKWNIMYDSTLNTQLHCDHNYEVSSYICNPFCLALIWPSNSFKEIYKWEIDASN